MQPSMQPPAELLSAFRRSADASGDGRLGSFEMHRERTLSCIALPKESLEAASSAGVAFRQYWQQTVHNVSALGVEFDTSASVELQFQSNPGLQIHLRLSGSGAYQINDRELTVGRSLECQLFSSVRPWRKRVYEPVNSSNRAVIIGVPYAQAEYFLGPETINFLEQRDEDLLGLSIGVSAEMRRAADEALAAEGSGIPELIREARLLDVVALCFLEVRNRAKEDAPRVRIRPSDRMKIKQVEEQLRNSYADPPSIAQLARSVGLNTHKLKYAFKLVNGCTIGEYCRGVRLETAARLLRMDVDVGLVAHKVGYEHVGNFAKLFRERYSVTPSEYRRLHREASATVA